MNYIKRLEAENAEKQTQLDELNAQIVDFMTHLQSSKFHTDTTIQVGDVFARLREMRMTARVTRENA